CKGAELIDHRVDGLADAEEFALERRPFVFQGNALRQIALGDAADDTSHFLGRLHEVADESVDRFNPGAPGTGDGAERGPLLNPPFLADYFADAGKLACAVLQEINYVVKGFSERRFAAGAVVRKPDGKITLLDGTQGGEEMLGLDDDGGRLGSRHSALGVGGLREMSWPRQCSGHARHLPRRHSSTLRFL